MNRHVNLLGKLGPGIINIINLVDVQSAGVWTKLTPNFLVDLDSCARLKELHSVPEGVRVACRASVVEPGDTLKTDTHIDHFNIELFT